MLQDYAATCADDEPERGTYRAVPRWRIAAAANWATAARVGRRAVADRSALAVVFTAVNAAAFLLVQPPVNDIWAARARASAAAHGVGLHYWFGWFSGMVPGNYSVLLPWLYHVAAPVLLAAIATVVAVALTRVLADVSRHPVAATWCAAVTLSANLWAARVPFAVGTALMIVAWIGIRSRRRSLAITASVIATLISPVSGAFTGFCLVGVFLHDRRRRWLSAVCTALIIVMLGGIGLYFGMPGPQPYRVVPLIFSLLAIALMLAMRPAPVVRTVLVVAAATCLLLTFIPNGMGDNFARLIWCILPAGAIATGRAPRWRPVIATTAVVSMAVCHSAWDLAVATSPTAAASSYPALVEHLENVPEAAEYRLQIPYDGTHTAAYQLLGVMLLASGWESQARNKYHAPLRSDDLDAATYRQWLDDNAVRWVAMPTEPLDPQPEDELIRDHTPDYLHLSWSNPRWLLYEVDDPTPIVEAPGHLIHASQAKLRITVPRAGDYTVRVHWSDFLTVEQKGAALDPTRDGWTTLTAHHPGLYTLTG